MLPASRPDPRAAGHDVYSPTLTGLGERAHLVSNDVDLDPQLIERARTQDRLWSIDTGHDLMITEPKFVADTLLEVAAS